MNPNLNVLIVDDEMELRRSLRSILTDPQSEFQFDIEEAENGLEAIQKISQKKFDLILMDVRMPEMNGLEALKKLRELNPEAFVVIMTAHANVQDAIQSIKFGAYDYIEKPVQPEKLKQIVKKAIETQNLVSNLVFSNPIFDDDIDSKFVGNSQKMYEVFDLIYKLSHVDTTVIIRGENGTGKELVARAIHHNSPRKHEEFVAVNCGAIPENLMESEFFGHEKGAFTGAEQRKIGKFQQANSGTLFLDEIGELKPEMQVKLLRVLQEKKFIPVGGNREIKTNARVVAATNQNLEKMIERGLFREDLFYRLNVMPIFLPPLRDRVEDIEKLVQFFIQKFSKKHNKIFKGVDPKVIEIFQSYNWPGNIRELENVIERAYIVEPEEYISLKSLPDNIIKSPQFEVPIKQNYVGPMDFDLFKAKTEKEFIINALKANHGRINKTVAEANIPKNTLLRKIKKYNINVKDYG